MSIDHKEALAAFSEKFGFLLGSGVPLVPALETITAESDDEILAETTRQILRRIGEGSSFHDSLAAVPAMFSPSYLSMVHAGECQGTLDTMMSKIARGIREGLIPLGGSSTPTSQPFSPEAEKELTALLSEAVERRASYLHLVPLPAGLRVRFRIDDRMVDGKEYPLSMKEPLIACAKYQSCLDMGEKMLPQDGRIITEVRGNTIDIRVNVLPTALGETVTMRLLIQQEQHWKPEVLFPNQDDRTAFRHLISSPFGLVIMAGPHGSGKTTTAYHALQQLREKGSLTIATVEMPCEMILPGIAQTSVRPHLGLTYSSLLAAIDRGDPDVIYVNDIPDAETMSRVLKLALTGHLVLANLHASTVEEVLTHMLDLKAPAHLLASALTGIVIQQLVRKVCPACAVSVKGTAAALKGYGDRKLTIKAREGKGCEKCNQSGYRGRRPLYEIFTPTKPFKDCLQTGDRSEIGKTLNTLERRTLSQAGAEAVADGTTTLAELQRVTDA